MSATRRAWVLVLIPVLVLSVAACARQTSPRTAARSETPPAATPTTSVADVRMLAGTWEGYAMQGSTPVPATVRVNPDGTYVSQLGASTGNGTFRVVDGQIVTEGHLSGSAFGSAGKSIATLKQQGNRTVLTGQGRDDRGPYSYELTKR